MGDTHNHNGVIDMVKNNMPNEKSINALAELFKVFGDQTRTKILSVLELTSEMCVCDICECVDVIIKQYLLSLTKPPYHSTIKSSFSRMHGHYVNKEKKCFIL